MASRGWTKGAVVAWVGVGLWLVGAHAAQAESARLSPQLKRRLAGVPVHFEPNRGQFDEAVKFGAHVGGYGVALTSRSTHYFLREGDAQARVVQHHLGGNAQSQVVGEGELPGKIHRLRGATGQHRHSLETYARARVVALYPGIDAVHYGNQRQLETDYVVAPGADPAQIRFRFQGAQQLHISKAGELLIRTAAGELRHRAPYAYQERDGKRVEVPSRFRLRDGVVDFVLGHYDRSRPLVIDPVLMYGSYFGGTGLELAKGVAVDAAGNVYITGSTTSTDLPVQSAAQGTSGGSYDTFVAKLSPDGRTLLYSTYIGGSNDDEAVAIQVHTDGTAYIAGQTTSPDFPATRCDTGGFTGCSNACPAGVVGAFQNYCGNASEVANNYCQTVTGCFSSDAFLVRLNTTGDVMLYSTFLGGNDSEVVNDLLVDSAGYAYIVGETASSSTEIPNDENANNESFPVSANAYDKVINDDDRSDNLLDGDGFIAVLDPTQNYGLGKIYISYLGGSGDDEIWRLALDPQGHVYLVGKTESTDFPALNGYATSRIGMGSDEDMFLVKLDRDATGAEQNLYGTYFGGDSREDPHALVVGAEDEVYVAGAVVGDSTFPTTSGVYQQVYPGIFNDAGFVSRFDTQQGGTNSLLWSTLVSSGAGEVISDMVLGPNGDLWFVGSSNNAGALTPVRDAFDRVTTKNAFFASLTTDGTTTPFLTAFTASAALPKFAIADNDLVTILAEGSSLLTENALKSTSQGGDASIMQLFEGDTDVALSVTVEPNPVLIGTEVTFTVSATNQGPTPVGQFDLMTFMDFDDEGFTLAGETAEVVSGEGECDVEQFDRTCVATNLGSGETFTFTHKVTPSGRVAPLGYAVALGGFFGGVFHTDTDDSNDDALGFADVVNMLPVVADLSVTQTDSADPVEVGDNVTYTLTVTNNGPDDTTGVTVVDTLPTGATLVNATPSVGSCSGTGPVTCSLGNMSDAQVETITVEVTTGTAGANTNNATVSGDDTDNNAGNDSSAETTTVNEPPPPPMVAGSATCNAALSAQQVQPGATDVPVLQMLLGAPADEAIRVEGLGVTSTGSGDEANGVTGFKIYLDANGDGVVDAGDTLLGSGSFGSDDATLSPSFTQDAIIDASASACLLVTYDFSSDTTSSWMAPVWLRLPRGPVVPWLLALLACLFGWMATRRRQRWAWAASAAVVVVAVACTSEDDSPAATGGDGGQDMRADGGDDDPTTPDGSMDGGSSPMDEADGGDDPGDGGDDAGGDTGDDGGIDDDGGSDATDGGAANGGGNDASGGSGNGGGNETNVAQGTYELEVTSVQAEGVTSGDAAVVSGLPIRGVTITVP